MAPRKVAVIGAGMVGIAAASWLQRDGHEVFVIDPNPPGHGASFGNAGCLNPSSVVPMSMPGVVRSVPKWLSDPLGPLAVRWSYLPTIAPWLIRYIRAGTPERVEAQALALKGLLGPCFEALMPLVRDAGAQNLVVRQGILIAYRSEASWAGDRTAWDLRRRNGVEFDANQLRQFDHNLSREYIRGIHVPGNGNTTNPQALVAALADNVLRNGGTLHRTKAVGFRFEGTRLCAVGTEEGELPADAAVIAAGAYSKPLAAMVGDRVPLETERGYHLMVRDPEVMPRVPTTDADGKIVATPMAMGLRFAGTVELAGLEAAPNWQRARMMMGLGNRLYPALAKSYPKDRISIWMGHRPSLPDSLAVIGPSRRSPDVFHAFGHGHVGMTGGPMTGKVIADLVAGRPPAIDVSPFRAARFG